nr:unnamed protein product [Digitaria exilis]
MRSPRRPPQKGRPTDAYLLRRSSSVLQSSTGGHAWPHRYRHPLVPTALLVLGCFVWTLEAGRRRPAALAPLRVNVGQAWVKTQGTEMPSRTIFWLVLFFNITAAQNANETNSGNQNIGVILDLQSLVGNIAHTCILMAVEDFYSEHSSYRTKLVLHVRDSSGDIQAATAAQVNCIASLITAYGWKEVVPIYEDTDYGRASNDQVEQELYKLMTMQTRVYIVHMSSAVASALFMKAKELGMMSEMSAPYANSMPDLNPVIWLGELYVVPKGWQIPTNGKKLRVGVQTSGYPEFMKVERDPTTNATTATGYAIDVFEEVLKRLPYAVPYEYVAFDSADSGSYNDFVYQVHLGIYDAAIGDIAISGGRPPHGTPEGAVVCNVEHHVDISRRRREQGGLLHGYLKGVVTDVIRDRGRGAALAKRRINNAELTGSFLRQLGIAIYFSFFADRERVDSILSRLVVIVWVFVLLVITSSYTANLSSILTVQQLQPTVTDVHELLRKGAYVGYHNGSYVVDLLEELGFDRRKFRAYNTPEDFADALSRGSENGGIAALIHEIPYIKIFLAEHCKGYTMVGPIYKSEGFGFAFPKRSPMVNDFSRAILSITEGDTIIRIENKWIKNQHICQNDGTISSSSSLNFKSFSGLFLVTGIASTSALLLALVMFLYKNKHRIRNTIGCRGGIPMALPSRISHHSPGGTVASLSSVGYSVGRPSPALEAASLVQDSGRRRQGDVATAVAFFPFLGELYEPTQMPKEECIDGCGGSHICSKKLGEAVRSEDANPARAQRPPPPVRTACRIGVVLSRSRKIAIGRPPPVGSHAPARSRRGRRPPIRSCALQRDRDGVR